MTMSPRVVRRYLTLAEEIRASERLQEVLVMQLPMVSGGTRERVLMAWRRLAGLESIDAAPRVKAADVPAFFHALGARLRA